MGNAHTVILTPELGKVGILEYMHLEGLLSRRMDQTRVHSSRDG
jgi:hypothetical protein